MDRIGNGYRVFVLDDVNGWVGDRVRVNITGAFRVTGKIIMEEKSLISVLKGGCAWVTHASRTCVYRSTLGWLGAKTK